MIYSIKDGEKLLFSNVNKLEAINGYIASQEADDRLEIAGKLWKNLWLDSNKIPFDAVVYDASGIPIEGETVYDKILSLKKTIEDTIIPELDKIEAEAVLSVNEQLPDMDGNITVYGNQIKMSATEEGEEALYVTNEINNLKGKQRLNANDKVLEWDNNGLRAYLQLEQSDANTIILWGRPLSSKNIVDETPGNLNRENLGTINLAMGSMLKWSEVVEYIGNGNWQIPSIPSNAVEAGITVDSIIAAANAHGITITGQYLLLIFASGTNGSTELSYTFTNLSQMLPPYKAGDGIDEDTLEDKHAIQVKRDPESTYEFTVGPDGVKYKPMVFASEADFNQALANGLSDGIYYVEE